MATAIKKFEVEVIKDRVVTELVLKRNKDKANVESDNHGANFIREEVTRTIPESYMVYFPSGHSLWFETKGQLVTAGLTESENFEVDADTGLPMEAHNVPSLKSLVQKNTRSRMRNEKES